MNKLFTQNEEKFLLNNYKGRTTYELADTFNKTFQKNITRNQVRSWLKNRGLSNRARKLFNKEETLFLKSIIKNKTTQEVANMFNTKFNRNITSKQITRFKQYRRLVSGFYGPKKGTLPPATLPIGTETTISNGYAIVKTNNTTNGDRANWKYKQRVVWEKAYGKIPDDCVVVFADQNKTNFSLDNLILVKRSELLTARTQRLIFDEPELTKTGLMLAKLMNKTCNKRRDNH